jgi:hypothetical protein
LYGGGVIVSCISNIFQKDGVQGRIGKRRNGLRNTSASGFDRDVVIFVKVDTSVLYGSVFGITKELLFHTHVATANDMFAVFPGAHTEGFALGTCVVGFFSPMTTTPATTSAARRREGTAVAATASSITVASPITTAGGGRGSGSLGAGPIIPASKSLSVGRGMMIKKKYLHNWGLGRDSSPLRIPHMRRNISRFSSINAERSC